jgi:hypothetical protein
MVINVSPDKQTNSVYSKEELISVSPDSFFRKS